MRVEGAALMVETEGCSDGADGETWLCDEETEKSANTHHAKLAFDKMCMLVR